MAVAICPSCEGQVTLKSTVDIGQRVRCPHCLEELEVVETNPVELDWAYDEDEDWDDDEWDTEEDEELDEDV